MEAAKRNHSLAKKAFNRQRKSLEEAVDNGVLCKTVEKRYEEFKEFEKHVKPLCSSSQVAMFGFCLRFLFFALLLKILLLAFLMSDLPAYFMPCVSALFTPTPQAMPCNTCPASCLTVGITSFNSGVPIVFAILNRCEPKPQPDW